MSVARTHESRSRSGDEASSLPSCAQIVRGLRSFDLSVVRGPYAVTHVHAAPYAVTHVPGAA
jgi:hypothetical protein